MLQSLTKIQTTLEAYLMSIQKLLKQNTQKKQETKENGPTLHLEQILVPFLLARQKGDFKYLFRCVASVLFVNSMIYKQKKTNFNLRPRVITVPSLGGRMNFALQSQRLLGFDRRRSPQKIKETNGFRIQLTFNHTRKTNKQTTLLCTCVGVVFFTQTNKQTQTTRPMNDTLLQPFRLAS